MDILIVILITLHLVPGDITTFQMEYPAGNVVTFTREAASTWSSKSDEPEDAATYMVNKEKLIQKAPDELTITPDKNWGLKPDTKWENLSLLTNGDSTISIKKDDNRIVFTMQEGKEKATTATISWKSKAK